MKARCIALLLVASGCDAPAKTPDAVASTPADPVPPARPAAPTPPPSDPPRDTPPDDDVWGDLDTVFDPFDPKEPPVAAGPSTRGDVDAATRRSDVMALLEGGDRIRRLPIDAEPPRADRDDVRIAIGTPTANGGHSAKLIASRLLGAASRIRRCYDLGLVETPDLEGEIVVSLRIATNGDADEPTARAPRLPVGLGACVAAALPRRYGESPSGQPTRASVAIRLSLDPDDAPEP